MGKLKQSVIEAEEYFIEEGSDYLTMARIMNEEWGKFVKKEMWGRSYTGFTEAAIKNAFQAGFMAGFEGKYFRETGQ